MVYVRKIIHHSLRVSIEAKEYVRLKEGFAKTSCRSLSEYARKLMFGRRVTIYHRNQSFDEFVEESIRLRKTLLMFCNQGGLKESERSALVQQIEDIKAILNKIADECLRK